MLSVVSTMNFLVKAGYRDTEATIDIAFTKWPHSRTVNFDRSIARSILVHANFIESSPSLLLESARNSRAKRTRQSELSRILGIRNGKNFISRTRFAEFHIHELSADSSAARRILEPRHLESNIKADA